MWPESTNPMLKRAISTRPQTKPGGLAHSGRGNEYPRAKSRLTKQVQGKQAAEQTVARLQSEGLLNDAKFARQWRTSRERRKPRSRGMIQRELRNKGVADDIIGDALEGYDSAAAAHRAAARYAARQAGHGRVVFDRRVGAFLGRRGSDGQVIRQTLERLRQDLDVEGMSEPDA